MWRRTEAGLVLLLAALATPAPAADARAPGGIAAGRPLPDLAVADLVLEEGCTVAVVLENRGRGRLPGGAWGGAAAPGAVTLRVAAAGRPALTLPLARLDPGRHLGRPGGRVRAATGLRLAPGLVRVTARLEFSARGLDSVGDNDRLERELGCGLPAPGAGARTAPPAPPAPVAPSPAATGSLLDAPPPPRPGAPAGGGAAGGDREPGEVLVASPGREAARALAREARALGLRLRRRRTLGALGMVVSTFAVPRGMSVERAMAALRARLPEARRRQVEANHRYTLMGGGGDGARAWGPPLVRWPATPPSCGRGLRLGLVDSAVDRGHPALSGARLEIRSFLPAGVPAASPAHGTAVAGVLAGRGPGLRGLLPGAVLRIAAVFRRRGEEVDTTAEWVVYALDWLVQGRVRVINLSLGGPRNGVLEAALDRVLEGRVAVVAAAGNGGPGGPPVFPAAQPGVVAVTAVDARLRPWPRATRGPHVDFAAPGVDLWVPGPGRGFRYASGTSYAAPFVAAALARMGLARLRAGARDLGPPGRDPVFGWGLVQAPGRCGA